MNLNKKGLNIFAISSIILVFFIASVIILGGTGFIVEVSDDYLFAPLENISTQFYNDGHISQEILQSNIDTREAYNEVNLLPDIFFLVSFISIFGLTMWTSIKSRKVGWISFTGLITLGSMIFLFILTIVSSIVTFFYDLFFIQLLERWSYNTPIFDHFINNMAIWSLVWFLLILVVNQIEFGRTDEDLNREDIEQ